MCWRLLYGLPPFVFVTRRCRSSHFPSSCPLIRSGFWHARRGKPHNRALVACAYAEHQNTPASARERHRRLQKIHHHKDSHPCSNAPPRTPKRSRRPASTLLTSSRAATSSLWDQVSAAPSEPGVYRFLDANDTVLYVGKAVSLRNRLRSYVTHDPIAKNGVAPAAGLPSLRIQAMLLAAVRVDLIVTPSEAAALALEATLVRKHKPIYNVLLKDDRRHPYAVITFSEEYPRVRLVRIQNHRNGLLKQSRYGKRDKYYGPFVNEGHLRDILRAVYAAFPIRQRAKPLHPSRPCMNYDIGLCPGVCQRLVSPEEYLKTIMHVDAILSGRVQGVLREIEADLRSAVANHEFEKAAILRDRRNVLTSSLLDKTSAEWLKGNVHSAAVVANPLRSGSWDVVACAGSQGQSDARLGKVALFQVREGCIVHRLVFTIQASLGPSHGNCDDINVLVAMATNAALVEHYGSSAVLPEDIPDKVILATPAMDDMERIMLAACLTEKRGKPVHVSEAGSRAKEICDLARRNAELEVELEQSQRRKTEAGLVSLASLLSPYFDNVDDQTVFHRIECYDVSHVAGSHPVGAMAVLYDGVPRSSENRHFSLSQSGKPSGYLDDFDSLKRTLRLRFGFVDEACSNPKRSIAGSRALPLPDLIVIDGGRGQLQAALDVLQRSEQTRDVPVVSLAKKMEEVFIAQVATAVNANVGVTDGVRVLCRARDEAHRLAVRTHRRVRAVASTMQGLQGVPGLGESRRAALLDMFPDGDCEVAGQSPDILQRVPGIGPALAKRILNHLKSSGH